MAQGWSITCGVIVRGGPAADASICGLIDYALALADGEPIAIGVDFATVGADGRTRSITGCLEPAA